MYSSTKHLCNLMIDLKTAGNLKSKKQVSLRIMVYQYMFGHVSSMCFMISRSQCNSAQIILEHRNIIAVMSHY